MASLPTVSVASPAPNPDVPLPQQTPMPSLAVLVPTTTVPQQPQQSLNELFLLPPVCLHQALQLVLAHARGTTPTSTSTTTTQDSASLLASFLAPGSVSTPVRRPLGGLCVTQGSSCSPSCSKQCGPFIEMHEFVLARLRATAGTSAPCLCCHACHTTQTAGDKRSKTVGDIFIWLMCFHRLTAAAMFFLSREGIGIYANTILQAYV